MNIAIIGGGIGGLTTAIALKRIGIEAVVYESAPEIKALGAGIALASNAMRAFEILGLKEELMQAGRPFDEFKILDQSGQAITASSTSKASNNLVIHRAELHAILFDQLNIDQVKLNKRLVNFHQEENGVWLKFNDATSEKHDAVIVADGIHSVARRKLIPDAFPRYSGYTCWRAICDNSRLEISEFSETWGKKGRFGLAPLNNNKLYWFACVNTSANNEVLKSYRISDLSRHFEGYHRDVLNVLNVTSDSDLIWGDIMDLRPLEQFAFTRIVLTGDAAHATTPNLGQGACQAIEDAIILADCMERDADYISAFRSFEKKRLHRTKWIVDTSRRVGRLAQMENPMAIALRNTLLKRMPASASQKQLKKIETVDF